MRFQNLLFILFCSVHFGAVAQSPEFNPLRYVNPFTGTGGHGHTYPGATAPFGMVQLSPDTRIDMMDWDGCSGYHYSDSLLYGFSHTHLSGTGVADYADILFKPYTGNTGLKPEEYISPFRKTNERAEAGYYSVFLEDQKILAELTATERVGVHRYTYPKNQDRGSILIDLRHRDKVLDSHLEQVGPNEIAGFRISKSWADEQHIYFVARFSKPIAGKVFIDMSGNPREVASPLSGKSVVALLDFYNDGEPLVVTVGISGVSMEGARKNLDAECSTFDFDQTRVNTQRKWLRELSKIEVETDIEVRKTIFYTALYHTMIVPNLWSDFDGYYRGRDGKIHYSDRPVYTVFSLWDTYRACDPLYTIIEPGRTADFINTFLLQYEQSGLLPVWELAANETNCMIGNHAIPVIADSYMKGIRDFDEKKALKAMEASVNQARLGQIAYRENGYVPSDEEPESVSKTLEYAYDDWCVGQMAKALSDDLTADKYFKRSLNYRNLFDPSSRFFRARNNGAWHWPFDPFEVNFNYTEANAWQYRFAAPQDVSGLMRLMGGRTAFVAELDALFGAKGSTTGRNQADITGLIGQYVHGNEPSHHMAYLYNYAGEPWKTQLRVRQILNEMYQNQPDGLSGNEDCGQMSAWYVLSAMGFYQVTPGDPVYTFGSPVFDKATIHLSNGKDFVIETKNNSASNIYVSSVTLNGTDWTANRIKHETLLNGGRLVFEMIDKPSSWGTAEADRPVSAVNVIGVPPTPFVASGKRSFRGGQSVELGCLDTAADIYYLLASENTDMTRSNFIRYEGPVELSGTSVLYAISKKHGEESPELRAVFSKIPEGLNVVRYNTKYNPQYTARGDEGLIDGIRGSKTDFRTGDWQGFEGVNLDFVVDLGKSRDISSVSAGFIQDENAWIFFPKRMQVEVSEDGQQFTPAGTYVCNILPSEKGVIQSDFLVKTGGIKGRYVRVIGETRGMCPDDHKGRGYPCWVFADEIKVD